MIRRFRLAQCIVLVFVTLVAVADMQSVNYPKPKEVDVVDDYFGTKVADPYRWMEDLNAPEVTGWVAAQNAVTFRYLDTLPMREKLRARITELWNYARVSAPYYKGRLWFYSRNTGLQRQSVVFTRASLTSAEPWPDPNACRRTADCARGFRASPDGTPARPVRG